jgi:hypothetical protein
MKSIFEKYPDISISADMTKSTYSITYTECFEEKGITRFFRKSKIVPKEKIAEKLELLITLALKD